MSTQSAATATVNGRTAAEWAAEAVRLDAEATGRHQAAADSFDRCDTDGFLSQWASGISGRLAAAKAEIARNHGYVEARALFHVGGELDGQVASTHEHYGQWGMCWVLNDAAAQRFGKRFFSPSKARSDAKRRANNAAKGFSTGAIRVAGYAKIDGSGTGLSGAASCYVATFPSVEALKAGDFEIVATDVYAD